ncbi:MAG TPA: porin [Polyangia bacterium]|nr:porin [Polyangia bacterium]
MRSLVHVLRGPVVGVMAVVALELASLPARAQDAPAQTAVPAQPDVAAPPTPGAPSVPSGGPQDRGPAAPPQPPPPVAPTAVPAPAPWQQQYEQIDQRTRALEKTAAGPIFQTDENGFSISSHDGLYQVRFKGLLQFDGRAFPDQAALAPSDTFVVRKIRPILAGTVLGLTDFFFSPDFGNITSTTAIPFVADAYLDTHPRPWLRFRVGKFKQPYGLERLQADQDLTFIERSLDQNLTPQREIGIQIWGDIAGGILRYEAGIFDGLYDNSITPDSDSNEGKTYGGRLFLQPFNTPGLKSFGRLGLGVAGSTGNELGNTTNAWLPTFKSAGQQTIFTYQSTLIASGRHSRFNPQLYYYNGPFGLLAEWVREYQKVARGTATGAYNNQAGHVTASVAIGGDVTFEGVKPHHALDVSQGYWGALEIGARYNWLDVDSAAFPTGADPTKSVAKAKGYGLAANWQLSRNLKLSGNFEETWFTEGAAKDANRPTEKVVIGRFQVAF